MEAWDGWNENFRLRNPVLDPGRLLEITHSYGRVEELYRAGCARRNRSPASGAPARRENRPQTEPGRHAPGAPGPDTRPDRSLSRIHGHGFDRRVETPGCFRREEGARRSSGGVRQTVENRLAGSSWFQ